MVMESLVLIEGKNVSEETLRRVSPVCAKYVVVGNALGFGVILYIAADSPPYLNKALQEFAEVPGVDRVVTLALQTAAD